MLAFGVVKYVKKMFELEFDRMKQPNPLIPRFVYRVRRLHYVYWEICRVARG